MTDQATEKALQILPDSYYDLLAYIVPSAYLILSYFYCFNFGNTNVALLFDMNGSWVFELFFGFVVLGGLYAFGIILTTISSRLIIRPTRYAIEKFSPGDLEKLNPSKNVNYFDGMDSHSLKIKLLIPEISPEITKRYARLTMIRNISLSSIMLFALSCIALDLKNTVFFLVASALSLFSYYMRYKWMCFNIMEAFTHHYEIKQDQSPPSGD